MAALARHFGTGEISLSEVQIVCLRLWHSGNPDLLLAEKGTQGLLEDYLGEALAGLPPQLQPPAVALLSQMVTAAGTRNVISAEDLTERVREEDPDVAPETLRDALDRLSESRLVHRERRRELYLYEITSEFLVPWISGRRAELERRQERRRERRRLLILGAIAAVLLIVAAGVAVLAGWALSQRSDAIRAQHAAQSQVVASQATGAGDLETASLLALEAYRLSPTVSARSAILDVADSNRLSFGLVGHNGPIENVEFSRDGRMLASVGPDDTVRLWDVATRREIGQPIALPFAAFAVAFDPDGKTVAAGGENGKIRLWSVATHRQLGHTLRLHTDSISGLQFSPDGRILAAAGDGKVIKLWDASTLRPLKPLTGHALFMSVAFSPNGKLVAAGGGHTVELFSLESRRRFGPLIHTRNPVNSVEISPSGGTLAAAEGLGPERVGQPAGPGSIQLWTLPSGRRLGGPISFRAAQIGNVAFGPSGRTFASSGSDGAIRLWDSTTHAELGEPLVGASGPVYRVAFSPDGRIIASGGDDGTVRLWDATNPRLRPTTLPGFRSPGVGATLAASTTGNLLVAGRMDGLVSVWNAATGRQIVRVRSRPGPSGVLGVAISPDGAELAALSDGIGSYRVALWSLHPRLQSRRPIAGHGLGSDLAFAPGGRILAVGGDGGINLWNLSTRHQIGRTLRQNVVDSEAFSPDGKILAGYGSDLRLWDVATRKRIGSPLPGSAVAGSLGFVNADGVAFSRDGKLVAAPGGSNTIRVWTVATHRPLGAPLALGSSPPLSVALSAGGGLLASSDDRGHVRLWDVATRQPLGAPITTSAVGGVPGTFVAFSSDGQTLAWVADNGTVQTWAIRPIGYYVRRLCGYVDLRRAESLWHQIEPAMPYQGPC